MKKKLTFVVVTSRSGVRRRFSVDKNVLYLVIIIAGFLLVSGVVGAWKYRENVNLQNKSLLLEAEKSQMEAIARTVEQIRDEESEIRYLLGLENVQNNGANNSSIIEGQ